MSSGEPPDGPRSIDPQDHGGDREAIPAPLAHLRVFGEAPSPASLTVYVRSQGWRLRGTLVRAALTAVLAPVAFLIPPHAPWGVGALAGGVLLARRRWTEKLTVVSFAGACPRCGHALKLAKGSRLLVPHALPCEGCHQDVMLYPEIEINGGPAR